MSYIGIEYFSNLPKRGCSSLRKFEVNTLIDDIASTGKQRELMDVIQVMAKPKKRGAG